MRRKVGGMRVVKDSIPCLISSCFVLCLLSLSYFFFPCLISSFLVLFLLSLGPSSCGLINERKTVLEWTVYFVTTITTWEITTFTSLFLFYFLSFLFTLFLFSPLFVLFPWKANGRKVETIEENKMVQRGRKE